MRSGELFTCRFCGGDAAAPDHPRFCDGQQGRIEAAEILPPLISGLDTATYATSAEAAASVEDERATQRRIVFVTIREAGRHGRTDDELQAILNLDGSSERPRRWELWKLDAIAILRDPEGNAVQRLTRTNRRAVVWIASEYQRAS